MSSSQSSDIGYGYKLIMSKYKNSKSQQLIFIYKRQLCINLSVYNSQLLNIMKKKYEKVVLKSDLFKSKTPERTPQKFISSHSRSPISKSPYITKKQDEKIDPNQLFQKVCCPNCRFIFKIIKNNQVLSSLNMQNKDRIMKNVMTQTEELFKQMKMLKNLSSQMEKPLLQKKEPLAMRTSVFKFEMEKISESPAETDRLDQTYRLQSATSKRSITKSNIKSSLLRIDERNNAKSIKISEKKSETSSQVFDNKSIFSKDRAEKEIFDIEKFHALKKELKQLITKLYQKNHQNQQIISFLRELPATIQIPAYQKMLISESNLKIIQNV